MPQGMPDLLDNTENSESIATQNISASQTVNGAAVDLEKPRNGGGGISRRKPHRLPDRWHRHRHNPGSAGQRRRTRLVEQRRRSRWRYHHDADRELRRYVPRKFCAERRYKGGAAGKLRWLRASVTAALTGGTSPTANVSANILKGGLRFWRASSRLPAPRRKRLGVRSRTDFNRVESRIKRCVERRRNPALPSRG